MVNTNFREYPLSSGRVVYAGKSAEQNDLLVRSARRGDLLLHTSAPGSPFVNLGEDVDKSEIDEAAVFCALKSQAWRDGKRDVMVHSFYRRDCSKSPFDKAGSWNVKRIQQTIKVKKSDIVKMENELENEKS